MYSDNEIRRLFQKAGPLYPEIDIEDAIMKKVHAIAKRKKAYQRYQWFGKISLIGFMVFIPLFFVLQQNSLNRDNLLSLIAAIFIIFSLLIIQLELFQKSKKTVLFN
ncbi:MAG: hypothetical protein Sapg2KO_30120 [Saprospiraceae bacterium]